MKRFLCFVFLSILLVGCSDRAIVSQEWGSFTPDKTYSYDAKFYAVQTVMETEHAATESQRVYDEYTLVFPKGMVPDYVKAMFE